MFDITHFISEINSKGIAKPSNYEVMIFGPGIDNANVERSIPLRCMATELPGRQVQTSDYTTYGIPTSMPTSSIMPELTLRFLLDEKHDIREYFEKWIDKIVGPYRNVDSAPNMYSLGFYDDYVGSVVITNYDERAEKTKTTTLIEAYPKTIAEQNLTWDNSSDFMDLTVTFVYRRYMNKET